MQSPATKAAMLLAAFSLAFSLVCPVAVTPIFVSNHHQAPTLHLAVNVAPFALVLPPGGVAQTHEVASAPVLDAPDLTCSLRC